MSAPTFLTAVEVARALGVSRSTAYRLMRQMGRVRAGRVVRVSREAFDAWVAANTETTARHAAARDRAQRRARDDQRQLGLFARR